MNSPDELTDFVADAEFDRLLASALKFRPEVSPPADLTTRAVRLAQEQERVQLEQALRTKLAQWERRKGWQRGISAIAAALVIAILLIGAMRLRDSVTASTDATAAQTTGGETAVTIESLTSSTGSSSPAPVVVGGMAFIAAIALLAIGRSLGRQEPQWFLATPRLT